MFLNPQLLLFGYGFNPYASGEFGSESGYFWIRSPVWKFKSATNPITCERVNTQPRFQGPVRKREDPGNEVGEYRYLRIRWRRKIVSSLLPNKKPIWRRNERKFADRANLLSRALWRMLWRLGTTKTRANLDTIGCVDRRMNSLPVDGEESYGFKNVWIRVDGALMPRCTSLIA